ncbi:hypothetical protein LTS10_010542 [Elasticomyces elasticus]|nr:hypothetical protein LTS10_010542 [Elasticomyces elasticus]
MDGAHAQTSSDDDIEMAETLTDVYAHKTNADAKETGITATTYNDDSAMLATSVRPRPHFLRLHEALRRYTEASGLHNVEQPAPIDEVVDKLKFWERQVVQEVSNGMPDPLSCRVQKAKSSLREVSLILAVDELAELIDAEEQPSCFQAFLRVLSTFRGSNVLVVGTSSDSRITDITMDNLLVIPGPAVLQKRTISRSEHYYPALDAFCVLVADVRRYHAKNVSHPGSWTALEHMSQFGRPLWHPYWKVLHDNSPALSYFVVQKLLGSHELTSFPSWHLSHLSGERQIVQEAFALLSSIVSLQIDPRIFTSADCALDAVNQHCRVALTISRTQVSTGQWSEPLAAWAAMNALHGRWSQAVTALVTTRIEPCMVDIGNTGGLAGRLVLGRTLAACQTPAKTVPQSDDLWFVLRSCGQWATVKTFLTNLLDPRHHELVNLTSPEILRGYVNCNHFRRIEKALPTDNAVHALAKSSFQRCCGITMRADIATIDLAMFVYHGKLNQPYDEDGSEHC